LLGNPYTPCTGHTVAAQLRVNGNQYEISYTITPCETYVDYEVYLKSDSSSTTVYDGTAPAGQPTANAFTLTFPPKSKAFLRTCLRMMFFIMDKY